MGNALQRIVKQIKLCENKRGCALEGAVIVSVVWSLCESTTSTSNVEAKKNQSLSWGQGDARSWHRHSVKVLYYVCFPHFFRRHYHINLSPLVTFFLKCLLLFFISLFISLFYLYSANSKQKQFHDTFQIERSPFLARLIVKYEHDIYDPIYLLKRNACAQAITAVM